MNRDLKVINKLETLVRRNQEDHSWRESGFNIRTYNNLIYLTISKMDVSSY